MSERNQKTLDAYNNGVTRYIDGTTQVTSGHQREWLDDVFAKVPLDASVLEIGSAFGRDAQYLSSKGYTVTMTDASSGFVEYLRKNGSEAELLDIVKNKPSAQYDVILACAVFLHFTDVDFQLAVDNVRGSLLESGKFVFSVKKGDGEEWSDEKMGSPRYFNYYQPQELEQKLGELGMKVLDMRVYDDKWIHAVSQIDQGVPGTRVGETI